MATRDTNPAGVRTIPAHGILNAVPWILTTGAKWHPLPQSHPNYKTVHGRFQQWCRREVLRNVPTNWRTNFARPVALMMDGMMDGRV